MSQTAVSSTGVLLFFVLDRPSLRGLGQSDGLIVYKLLLASVIDPGTRDRNGY